MKLNNQKMTALNLRSFILAAILLIFAVTARVEKNNSVQPVPASSFEASAVSAAAPTAVFPVTTPRPKPPPVNNLPTVQISAGLVKALGSADTLFELHSQQRWPIASLTKLMTAVVALEKIGPDKKVTVSERAVATEGEAGNLSPGDQLTVAELIAAMLVTSSNDAAMALAEYYDYDNFIDAMQAKAADLGLLQTAFFDPTGLSLLNQSTADDIALLVAHIAEKYPEILSISAQPAAKVGQNTLRNINSFAGQPGFLGGKTGFLDEARGNLV